ncbi:MAG: hypothetical protein EXR69_10385 [Myxococcales bacterium]|nr:hypothetical protein [Myxococcales bacterium]
MRLTRRQLVIGTPALLGACAMSVDSGDDTATPSLPSPAPERAPEPAEWTPPGTEDEAAFAWGLQSGDATAGAVLLSVRSTHTELTIVVVEASGDGWVELTRQQVTRSDEAVQLEVTGLQPDTAYRWVVLGPDDTRSRIGRFRSALGPDGWRVIEIGATCCLGGNEPWPSLSLAALADLDLFILAGDTVYADNAVALEEYRGYWRAALSTEGLRALTARTSIIGSWDDHEVGNNWTAETLAPGQFDAALLAYRESLPQRAGPTGGIWRTLSWGAVADVYVLDCRGERAAPDQYISAEQLTWIKEQVSASTARFKIIVTSVPISDYFDMLGTAQIDDRWQGYPAQRDDLLTALGSVPGVLWLGGDFHMGAVASLDPPGSGGPAEGQWEVLVGPAGSTLNVLAELYEDTTGQFPVLFAAWNVTRLRLDPGTGEVRVTFVGDDGAPIDQILLML